VQVYLTLDMDAKSARTEKTTNLHADLHVMLDTQCLEVMFELANLMEASMENKLDAPLSLVKSSSHLNTDPNGATMEIVSTQNVVSHVMWDTNFLGNQFVFVAMMETGPDDLQLAH